jgi:hypothetical protein
VSKIPKDLGREVRRRQRQDLKDAEISRLSVSIDSTERHEIECADCHDVYAADSIDVSEFLEDVYDMGWRQKGGESGAVCKQCRKELRQ